MEPAKSFSFSLQGNIGCGKTTLLRILQKAFPSFFFFNEPVNEWENIGGKVNLLRLYYKDPARWALTFQTFALQTRAQKYKEDIKKVEKRNQISERSLQADHRIFALALKDDGYLTQDEYVIYKQYYKGFTETLEVPPLDGYIYLRCPPNICSQRIGGRNRKGEEEIPLKYLELLHRKHEEWLGDLDNVLILDSSVDFKDDIDQQNKILEQIAEFFESFFKI